MPHFALICIDKPASLALRMATREAHFAHVAAHPAPAMAPMMFVAVAEKVMMSVHIKAPSLSGANIDISKTYRSCKRIRYV